MSANPLRPAVDALSPVRPPEADGSAPPTHGEAPQSPTYVPSTPPPHDTGAPLIHVEVTEHSQSSLELARAQWIPSIRSLPKTDSMPTARHRSQLANEVLSTLLTRCCQAHDRDRLHAMYAAHSKAHGDGSSVESLVSATMQALRPPAHVLSHDAAHSSELTAATVPTNVHIDCAGQQNLRQPSAAAVSAVIAHEPTNITQGLLPNMPPLNVHTPPPRTGAVTIRLPEPAAVGLEGAVECLLEQVLSWLQGPPPSSSTIPVHSVSFKSHGTIVADDPNDLESIHVPRGMLFSDDTSDALSRDKKPLRFSSLQEASVRSPQRNSHRRMSTRGAIQDRMTESLRCIARHASVWSHGNESSQASIHELIAREATTHTAQAELEEGDADIPEGLNQYAILYRLGRGVQGDVLLAMDTTSNKLRAIKAVPRPRAAAGGVRAVLERQRKMEQLEREVSIMKKCRHRNVVALYEVIDDPDHDSLYLVMQYVEHGPIATVVPTGHASRTFSAKALLGFLRQLASGLGYLHRHGVVHRDIKPENVLLGDAGQVYLADFGVSDVFDYRADSRDMAVAGTRGTLAFMAPELVGSTNGGGGVDGKAVDVWALGVTMYVLYFGCLPFEPTTDIQSYCNLIQHAPIDFAKPLPAGALEGTAGASLAMSRTCISMSSTIAPLAVPPTIPRASSACRRAEPGCYSPRFSTALQSADEGEGSPTLTRPPRPPPADDSFLTTAGPSPFTQSSLSTDVSPTPRGGFGRPRPSRPRFASVNALPVIATLPTDHEALITILKRMLERDATARGMPTELYQACGASMSVRD
jgi:serine/threonine protein kinase